jgi:large subunit ribosomal protein L25
MATKHILKAKVRDIKGRKVKQLRSSGFVPANVFGKNQASINVQVANKDFSKVYAEAGESSLIYLEVEGEKESRPVLVRDVSHHPITGYILHVDFNQVSLKEKVVAPVSVNLVGESPAEQEKLGILVQQLDEVELEALPTEMPESLEVSIENLKQVGDAILVKDIAMNSGVTIKSDPEAIVAKIEALAKEEVAEAPAATEEAAATEGEAPAATEAPAGAENSDQENKS